MADREYLNYFLVFLPYYIRSTITYTFYTYISRNIGQYFKNTFNIIVNIIILRLTKYMSVDNIKLMIFTNSMWTLLFLYSFQYRPQIHTAFVMSDAVNEPEPVFLCVSLTTLPYSCIMQAPAKQYIVSKLLSIVYGC